MADDDRKNALLAAGTIAPLIGAGWGAISLVLFGVATSGTWQWEALAALPLYIGTIWFYGVIIALILTWTLGILWHAWSMAYGWRSRWAYIAAGAALGLLLPLIFALTLPGISIFSAEWPFFAAWFTSCSIVVAWVGWLIRRPDRDAPNPPTAAP